MTDTLVGTEISQLTAAGTLDGSEVIPADQSGRTVRVTSQQIANLAAGAVVVGGTGLVDSVNGHVGTVVLNQSDIGLTQVDNTSDATKNAAFVSLLNHTIDGAQNTLLNIPQSSVTGLPGALAAVVNTAGTGLSLAGNTVSLANTAVSPAQYGTVSTVPQFTVDQQGRVTAAANLSIVIGEAAVTNLTTDLGLKAPLASPTFTGVATSPVFALTGGTGAATAVRWVGGVTSTAPTTGTWLTGDGVIGTGGKVYVCTAGGTPGTWVDVGSGSSGPPTGAAAGDLSGTYPNPGIATAAVTLAKQANLPGLTIQGNNSGSAGVPLALNTTQVKTMLAIAESDVASLTADLANLAPQANPTFTGTATAPIIVGGSATGSTLTLKPSSNGAPTGPMSLYGGLNETVRLRSDGHIVLGSEPAWAAAANSQVSVRTGTVSGLDTTGSGCALSVAAGDDGAPTGNGTGMFVTWNVATATTGQTVALSTIAHGQNTAFAGALVALQSQAYDEVGMAAGSSVFGANFTANTGRPAGGGGAVDPVVTVHTPLSALEVDSNDRAGSYGLNAGSALRVTANGAWDVVNGINLTVGAATQSTFKHAIFCSTNLKASSGSAHPVTVWATGAAYVPGSLVALADGTKYQSITTHTSTTGGAHPTPPGNTTDWFQVRPSSLLYTWSSTVRFNMAELVTNDGGTTKFQAKVDSTNVTPVAGATWAAWSNNTGPNTNLLWFGPATALNDSTGTPITQITASGDMRLAGNIGFNGKAAQATTGWAAPTGTLSRAAFDQSTVTLANLAQRVAALVTDLRANGVIG